jgi:hypothetical protein
MEVAGLGHFWAISTNSEKQIHSSRPCSVRWVTLVFSRVAHPDDLRESVVRIQNAIEAIDRAITDERQLAALTTPGVKISLLSQPK